ncbi:hypothetical protein HUU42_04660 [bacterium]|nr:hypothetical protein [bacterium]
METLKKDALDAISKLPESATIEEIMYRLYVIDKVRKGQEAVNRGDVHSPEDIKLEMRKW